MKELLVRDNKVYGILTEDGEEIHSKAVILTTGTYLNSDIMCGHEKHKGGPHGEKNSMYLSDSLAKMVLNLLDLRLVLHLEY